MNEYKTIAAIGDSITNGFWDEEALGWFGRLSQKLAKNFPYQYTFHNMSKGGDTVCDLYHRFSYEVFSRDIQIVIIHVGINDLVRTPHPTSEQYLSESFRKKYWNRLLDLAKKHKSKIVVLDILPIVEETRASGEKYNFNVDVIAYNKMIEEMCKDKNITFIKRFDNWAKRNLKEFYVDTVHPNAKGHQILCDEVYEELIKNKIVG